MHAQLYRTQWGWGSVVFTSLGIREVLLPKALKVEILHELPKKTTLVEEGLHPAVAQLLEYFLGLRAGFELTLDLEEVTPFQKRVYEALVKIPYGTTESYQSLAEAIGLANGARAVARALAQNPIPIIIPCHRVIQKDGRLGGYSSGPAWKKILLDLERSYSENARRKETERTESFAQSSTGQT